MSTITIENVPASFKKKVWNKTDFSKIVWIYYDWMDWCQYNEVIPDANDVDSYNAVISNKSDWTDAFSFLNSIK